MGWINNGLSNCSVYRWQLDPHFRVIFKNVEKSLLIKADKFYFWNYQRLILNKLIHILFLICLNDRGVGLSTNLLQPKYDIRLHFATVSPAILCISKSLAISSHLDMVLRGPHVC